MRNVLATAVLLAATHVASGGTYISIGSDALPTALGTVDRDNAHAAIASEHDGVAVLEIDDGELAALSDQMHLAHHRCGGFMVHASLEDALAAPKPAPKRDYTLDHAPTVERVLPLLEQARIAQTIRELSAMPNRFY
ncbi:MAG: hypothetical protein ABI678_09765, partial [Kofleriaceae bacterium]